MSIDATPQERAFVDKLVQDLRAQLMEHAHSGAINAGFADRHARFLCVIGCLFGAAQRYALSQHGGIGLYEVFKAMAAVMAVSDPKKIALNSHVDFLDEQFGAENLQRLILPKGKKV